MNTFIPDWGKYLNTSLLTEAQLAPGDFLTVENNGWVTGSWGRHRCTGCVIDDPEEKVIVWEKDLRTQIQFDPSETDYVLGCSSFYVTYNNVKILFKKV